MMNWNLHFMFDLHLTQSRNFKIIKYIRCIFDFICVEERETFRIAKPLMLTSF
jgi:hypothetical protein